MACKRQDRFRHNTIAFWLSDDEKKMVEARIILSGLPKGEYYRRAILGQSVQVVAGNYMSTRVAIALEQILKSVQTGTPEESTPLKELIGQLLEINRRSLKVFETDEFGKEDANG